MLRKSFNMEKEFENMRNQINRVMGNFLGEEPNSTGVELLSKNDSQNALESVAYRTPFIELDEKDEEYIASVEIPGIDKKDVNLEVKNGILSIKAQRKIEFKDESEEGKYTYKSNYAGFAKSMSIPQDIDENKITAKHDNGVLRVHMPKVEEAKSKGRVINIS
ncbi:MAG: Hsp20/alpha crystallin family protein [Candidatus Woesearchaeota archaeon]